MALASSCGPLRLLSVRQIIQIAQNLTRIEGPDSVQVDLEVFDQMLHHPDDLVMGLQKICLVFLVCRIGDKFIQSIAQVGHAIHRRESIGILEILILHTDNATNMLQFMGRPTHNTFCCNIIFVTRHDSIFTQILFEITITNKERFKAY